VRIAILNTSSTPARKRRGRCWAGAFLAWRLETVSTTRERLLHADPRDTLGRATAALVQPQRPEPLAVIRTFVVLGRVAPSPSRWPELPAGGKPEVGWAHGGLLLRQSRHDDAAKQLAGLDAPDAWLLAALAGHGRGKIAEAQAPRDRFTRWADRPSPEDAKQTNWERLGREARLEPDLLRQEVDPRLAAAPAR
jgi:hypothetical protein